MKHRMSGLVVLSVDSRADELSQHEALELRLRMMRAGGQCSVCEAKGFEPFELDDSARCNECRP